MDDGWMDQVRNTALVLTCTADIYCTVALNFSILNV